MAKRRIRASLRRKKAKERAAQREREKTLARAAEEKAAKQRIISGTKKKKEVLADEAFMHSAPRQRVKFWQDFQRRYPAVSVTAELEAAQKELRVTRQAAKKVRGKMAADEDSPEARLAREIAATKQELRDLRNVRGLEIPEWKRRNEALRKKIQSLEKKQQQMSAGAYRR